MNETNPNLPKEKPTSHFPFGLVSILFGFFLLISSCMILLPNFLMPDPDLSNVQTLLFFYVCLAVPVLAVFGIFLGIIGVGKKTAWSWVGIVLNLIVLCAIPVLFLLMLTILATA
jgi:hypothetical protein